MIVTVLKVDTNLNWNEVKKYSSLATKKRLEKCNNYIDDTKKVISLLTELLIRYKAANMNTMNINYNEHGKPYLLQPKDIFFSVSHSDNFIAYIQDTKEIGIDIEKVKELKHDIVSRFFTNEEQEYIRSKNSSKESIYTIWTRKEAYLKREGTGFKCGGFKKNVVNNDILKYLKTYKIDTYILSICTSNVIDDCNVEIITSHQLLEICKKYLNQ